MERARPLRVWAPLGVAGPLAVGCRGGGLPLQAGARLEGQRKVRGGVGRRRRVRCRAPRRLARSSAERSVPARRAALARDPGRGRRRGASRRCRPAQAARGVLTALRRSQAAWQSVVLKARPEGRPRRVALRARCASRGASGERACAPLCSAPPRLAKARYAQPSAPLNGMLSSA